LELAGQWRKLHSVDFHNFFGLHENLSFLHENDSEVGSLGHSRNSSGIVVGKNKESIHVGNLKLVGRTVTRGTRVGRGVDSSGSRVEQLFLNYF
jgi:hypothetical protein